MKAFAVQMSQTRLGQASTGVCQSAGSLRIRAAVCSVLEASSPRGATGLESDLQASPCRVQRYSAIVVFQPLLGTGLEKQVHAVGLAVACGV